MMGHFQFEAVKSMHDFSTVSSMWLEARNSRWRKRPGALCQSEESCQGESPTHLGLGVPEK